MKGLHPGLVDPEQRVGFPGFQRDAPDGLEIQQGRIGDALRPVGAIAALGGKPPEEAQQIGQVGRRRRNIEGGGSLAALAGDGFKLLAQRLRAVADLDAGEIEAKFAFGRLDQFGQAVGA